MAGLTAEEADREFIDLLRHVIGKAPLPDESRWQRFTLDGARYMTAPEWAATLGISRQAAWMRRVALRARLTAGDVNAYAVASGPAVASQQQRGKCRKRQEARA